MRTMRSSPTQAARTYHRIRSGHTFPKHNFITYVGANPLIRSVCHAVMFHFLFYHIRSSFAISYKTKKLRQRPTLPGDIVPLFRPQGAGDDILTKYNVAH